MKSCLIYSGKREYSPRYEKLEDAIAWRESKEKEYGLVGELGRYPKEKTEEHYKKKLLGMQDEYRKGTCYD